VLKLDAVGTHDNFFDLGGHSLLIIRLRNRLQEVINGDVPIVDLFKYPTINSFAEHLSATDEQPVSVQPAEEDVEMRKQSKKHRKELRRNAQTIASRARG
jgi:hypothetical protein